MDNCFEATMVRHCAATLAGHKCGSLFSWKRGEAEEMERAAERLNAALNGRGVYLKIMKKCPMGGLVYVNRAEALERRLEDPEIRRFLSQYGYEEWSEGACLDCLKRHICDQPSFPHEVGIFLDYPLEDVVGFIRHRGKCFTCCGCWKSYGDPAAAQQHFDQLAKCTAVYLRLFHSGTPILKLAVAA